MAYGAIVQDLLTAGGPPATVAATHNLGDATHCTFLVQDRTTPGGAITTFPLLWTSVKAANADTISDSTGGVGTLTVSALVVAAHSLIDVGPIVNGITRGAAAVSPYVSATFPAMRSLHYNVPFTIANAAAASAAVTITHRLQTANVVVVVSPTGDPTVPTAGGARPMVIVHNIGADTATTCQLQAQTQDNVVSNAGVDTTVNFDVMVLARWGSGLHSRIVRPHLTALGAVGDDYGAGDRAQAGAVASYGAIYTNVDDLAVAPGVAYTHNIGATASLIAFVDQTVAVGAAKNTTGITNRATSTTTCTLERLNELAAATLNARVIILRPYSVVIAP